MRTLPTFHATLLLAATLLPAARVHATGPAAAPATQAAACISFEDGWIRMPPAPRPMLAGFGRIANRCVDEQVVVAVRSPRFDDVSLHETRLVDGVSRMRELERLPVAPAGDARLQPGGLHLMLMDPTSTLKPGSHVAIEFTLKDGRHVLGDFEVRNAQP